MTVSHTGGVTMTETVTGGVPMTESVTGVNMTASVKGL